MKFLTSWFIRNPVAANLIMCVILAGGALSLTNIRVEGFPKLAPDTVEISIVDFGASAAEVDQSITRSLEQALNGLPGLKELLGYSVDGQATVLLRKQDSYDLARLLEDARLRLDNITTLPSTAEKPVIRRLEFSYPALIVQIFGDVPQADLQKTAGEIKQRLLALPEVSAINQWGEQEAEISIEVMPEVLQSFGITLQQLTEVITQSSQLYRTGEIKAEGGRIQLRADRLARTRDEFESIPVFTEATGRVVRLGEIARITRGFSDQDVRVVYQGKPTIGFEIAISQRANVLRVSEAVNGVLHQSQDLLSGSISAEVWADQSGFVSERLNTLKSNAWQGLLLVFIILALFLRIRLAFWVAMGIPISVMGVFVVMGSTYVDYSLNDVTTLGMIIVLGIIVDDAVVVGESIHSAQQEIDNNIRAAEVGAERVATATVFGVLTTVAAFYPMTVLDSALGKLLASFAVVVIIALLFSLFESKFILPSHLVERKQQKNKVNKDRLGWLTKIRRKLDIGLRSFTENYYLPSLLWCLQRRRQVLVAFFLLVVATFSCIERGLIRTVFFPSIPSNIISVKVQMDTQSPFVLGVHNVTKLEQAARKLNRQWILDYSLSKAPIKTLMSATVANNIELYAELSAEHERPFDALEVIDRWRGEVGNLEGAVKLNFNATEETAGGFSIEVYADDAQVLQEAVGVVVGELSAMSAVNDVTSDLQALRPEMRLQLNEHGESLGLRIVDIAAHIGDGLGGLEMQRFVDGNDEVKVFLRYPESERDSVYDLQTKQMRLDSGEWVPLAMVVNIESSYSPQYFWRKNQRQGATIAANIDKSAASATDVFNALMASQPIVQLSQSGKGISILGAGELQREGEISSGLGKALLIAIALIYSLIAIPLKSYLQPLVILSVVPFGFVGAALGHAVMGLPFSVLSFFGMLALAGIVVNNSLVMVTRYNQACADGESNPLVTACLSRVRAIFLTTTTTIAGLTPLLWEQSEQAQYLIPAAVSLVFGQLFATIITLLIVPVLLSFGKQASAELEAIRHPSAKFIGAA